MSDEENTVISATPFSQQLAFLSRGCLDAECTQALLELVKAVRATGKTGVLTLQLKISMLNQRDENAVKVTPAVTTKQPKLAPYESVMFSTYDGDLLRDDPKQRKLDLQVIPAKERGPLQSHTDKSAPAVQQ